MVLVANDWKIDALIVISTLCILLFYKIKSIYLYFEKKNIKYVKPKFLLGSEPDGVLFKIHITKSWDRIYKQLENEKYGGFYQAILPMLMIRDPEYINVVLKTSFEHFSDRVFLVDEKTNPLDQHLFFIRGKKWKYIRSKISPLFSQVKLKWMYEEIEKCANIFDECINELADGKDIDMKELLARCTTDVIASCALGVEPQSLKDPNSEFRAIGKEFFDPNKKNQIIGFFRFSMPRVLLFFKIKTVTEKIKKFFLTTTEEILHQRRSTGLVRKDFVHLLLELKEKGTVQIDTKETDKNEMHDESTKENIELTDNLLAAQSFVFFLAGFETTSTALYFTLYMLAKHKDIQDRARKEVQEVKAKYGQLTFDSLKELKFLNNCISEAMRLYPPLGVLNRECTKDYTLPDGTFIEKGMNILIPTYSLHRDPKYFPEPTKFKPDRFENPPVNGTYLPFGDGPRICIGKRFAEAVVTTILARSLDKYEFDVSPMDKHEDVIKLNPRVLTSTPYQGLLLRIHKLNGAN
ncbi:cytochrome P450 6a9 [Halyomorpha halys]|uniref:cytochrome P450 6a9 n=1 Tax=Halyomorpha halys TaxID=286706 RepID=UPI0034D25E68